MTKHYPMTESQKKMNRAKAVIKYNEKIKNDEILCKACLIPVKYNSLFYHNKSKKHLANVSEEVDDTKTMIIKLAKELEENNEDPVDLLRKMYCIIKEKYYDDDGDEIIQDTEYSKTNASTKDELDFVNQKYPAPMKMTIDDLIENNYNSIGDVSSEKFKKRKEDINNESPKAIIMLLELFRDIKKAIKTKIIDVSMPKEDIKKKEEYSINYIEEDFPIISKFYKAYPKAQLKCLEDIYNYHSYMFESRELFDLCDTISNENEQEYLNVYKSIFHIKEAFDEDMKENKIGDCLENEEDVEEEEEEEY